MHDKFTDLNTLEELAIVGRKHILAEAQGRVIAWIGGLPTEEDLKQAFQNLRIELAALGVQRAAIINRCS